MQSFRHRTSVSVFLLATFVLITVAGTRSTAVQTPSNVLVTNSTSQPVPVAVQGTPNVRALQGGTWNVYLLGSPTLRINNAPSAPVPVQPNSDKQSLLLSKLGQVAANASSGTIVMFNNTGHRIILDSLCVTSNGDPGEQATDASLVIWSDPNTVAGIFEFPLHTRAVDNASSELTTPLAVPVEAGEQFNTEVFRPRFTNLGYFHVTYTAHMVQ
jgi:hypothetical protein